MEAIMAAQTTFPQQARDSGYLPFIHFTEDELHDVLFLVANAARGLHAAVRLCKSYRGDEFDPREMGAMLEPLYRQIADAIQLENEFGETS
jgi:hypothetical protein